MSDQRILLITDDALNGEWIELEGHITDEDGTLVHLGHTDQDCPGIEEET